MSHLVALTGSTGFIGSEIARQLKGSNYLVRALVRPESVHKVPSGCLDEIIQGNVNNISDLEDLVQDATAVIHCAGLVRAVSDQAFFDTNAESLDSLVKAVKRSNSKSKLLYLSSLAAREPSLSAYSHSKYQAERRLAEKAYDLPWMVLRPPAVYGPGDKELLPLLLWMKRGLAPVFGSPGNRVSLLYVSDLGEAVLSWLRQDLDLQGCYELHDGSPRGYSWLEVIETVSRLTGKRIVSFRIPKMVLYLLASVNSCLMRLLGRAPMMTPGKVNELTYPSWECSNTKICRVLDWKPKITLEEGLRRSIGTMLS